MVFKNWTTPIPNNNKPLPPPTCPWFIIIFYSWLCSQNPPLLNIIRPWDVRIIHFTPITKHERKYFCHFFQNNEHINFSKHFVIGSRACNKKIRVYSIKALPWINLVFICQHVCGVGLVYLINNLFLLT
jgi:hypothetical protein